MIKFGRRHNLIYAMIFVIFNFLLKADSILMKNYIKFNGSLFLTSLMFFTDFLSGLMVYLYNLKYLKEKETSKFMGIELIQAPSNIPPPDSSITIFMLLLMASFLDFAENILSSFYIPEQFQDVSKSIEWRLKSIIICSSAFFCYFSLKFPIFKHQKITIITIYICLLIVIITEIIVYTGAENHSVNYILKVIFLMIIDHIFNSSLDIIEKYLLEYDFMNPYLILMIEGIMGFILSLIFSIFEDQFKQIRKIYNNESQTNRFSFLIICIVFFFY